jgi:hypothetical protein
VRGNKLTDLIQKEAVAFLKETVVLMWDNPLDHAASKAEVLEPRGLFNAHKYGYDERLIPNPLHLFTPRKPFIHI